MARRPAPAPIIVGTAEFDPQDPPRILATMLAVVRQAEHVLGEDAVVGRALSALGGTVGLDDCRAAYIVMLTVGWLTRSPVGPPRRYSVTPGPASRILDIGLEHEASYWLGRLDQLARGGRAPRVPWPMP